MKVFWEGEPTAHFWTSEPPHPPVHGWLAFPNWAFCVPWQRVATPLRWNVYSQVRAPLVTENFLGPGDMAMTSPRANEKGASIVPAFNPLLEDCRLCVLFLALRAWFETAFLIQPYSGHQSLASRLKRQGQVWKSAELQADSHWTFFSSAQVFLPRDFHSKWHCCFTWQRVSGEGWSLH